MSFKTDSFLHKKNILENYIYLPYNTIMSNIDILC